MEPEKIVILNKFTNDKSSEIIEMTKDFIEFLSQSFIEVMEYAWLTDVPQISNATFILFLDHKILENAEKKAAIEELILNTGKERVNIVMEQTDKAIVGIEHLPIFWIPDTLAMRNDLEKLFLHDFIKEVLGGEKVDEEKETIYLATADDDYIKFRKYIKRELERRGYKILPKEDFLLQGNEKELTIENEEKIFSMMRASAFSVHFGRQEIIEKITKYTSQKTLENNIAYQLEKALYKHDSPEVNEFKRIIWDYNMVSDSLADLEYTEKQSKKTEYLHSSVDQLKTFILRLLNDDLPEGVMTKPQKQTIQKLYVIHKCKSSGLVSDLSKKLSDNQLEVMKTEVTDDFDENRKRHQQALKTCDVCLILDEDITDLAWLNSKIHDMLKISGLRSETPLVHKAIFTEKDPSSVSSFIADDELEIIRYTENSVIDLVEQFIAGAKESV